ncbi:MAG TPA: NUDIX domain-containing protein [Jatrophihabitans sp.]|nr:NUDIX domain-containing protein [Jatrophihabitans sp.]
MLLGRLGGPFWAAKRDRNWSIPKGELEPDESAEHAARREFLEELGLPVPAGNLLDLGSVKQSGGKTVRAFALEAELEPAAAVLGTFELEWPPRSGRRQQFAELAEVAWLPVDLARRRLITAQQQLLDRLIEAIAAGS